MPGNFEDTGHVWLLLLNTLLYHDHRRQYGNLEPYVLNLSTAQS